MPLVSIVSLFFTQVALLAVFAITIGMLFAGAYQAAPPSVVTTFEYSYLIFVALWDILFLNIIPTVTSLSGMALIVVAGLFVLRRPVSEVDCK